jgi:hypothetical protein
MISRISNAISNDSNSMRTADNLTTFMCRLSRNLGASTSWNPKGLSSPVMGLLYLYLPTLYRKFSQKLGHLLSPTLHHAISSSGGAHVGCCLYSVIERHFGRTRWMDASCCSYT